MELRSSFALRTTSTALPHPFESKLLTYITGTALLYYVVPQQQQDEYDQNRNRVQREEEKVRGWYWTKACWAGGYLFCFRNSK